MTHFFYVYVPFLFLGSSGIFFLSDNVIQCVAKSTGVQTHLHPEGILIPCYHSICRAAIASSPHDISYLRRDCWDREKVGSSDMVFKLPVTR